MEIKKVAVLGWPAAFLQIAWNAGSIVLYNILGRLGDTSITAIASLTNGFRIEAIIYLPAFALNMAASVLIGQNHAKKMQRVDAVRPDDDRPLEGGRRGSQVTVLTRLARGVVEPPEVILRGDGDIAN